MAQWIRNDINIDFVGRRRSFWMVSIVAVLLSIGALIFNVAVRGNALNYGTDFRGGSQLQIEFEKGVTIDQVRATLHDASYRGAEVVRMGGGSSTANIFLLRLTQVSSFSKQDQVKAKQAIDQLFPGKLRDFNYKEGGDKLYLVFKKGMKIDIAAEQARKAAARAEAAARYKDDAKKAKQPGAEKPGAEKPDGKKPGGKESSALPSTVDDDKQADGKNGDGKPAAKKPAAKKPAAKKPVAKKPVAKKPVAKKPVAKKPVAKKPAAKKPVAKKPVAKKPPLAVKPAPAKTEARQTEDAKTADAKTADAKTADAKTADAKTAASASGGPTPAPVKSAAAKSAAGGKKEKTPAGPSVSLQIERAIKKAGLHVQQVQLFGRAEDRTFEITLGGLGANLIRAFEKGLGKGSVLDIPQAESVGAKMGRKLRDDGIKSVLYALLLMLVYIAFRFDFRYAPGAVVALAHDVTITVGLFAITWTEFSLPVVAALLTIAGYSINDTIVVYDRIRENLARLRDRRFPLVVNASINETLSRTLLTSLTTLFTCVAIWVMGTGVLKTFAFALTAGVVIGTYSSIFIASPLVVVLNERIAAAKRKAGRAR